MRNLINRQYVISESTSTVSLLRNPRTRQALLILEEMEPGGARVLMKAQFQQDQNNPTKGTVVFEHISKERLPDLVQGFGEYTWHITTTDKIRLHRTIEEFGGRTWGYFPSPDPLHRQVDAAADELRTKISANEGKEAVQLPDGRAYSQFGWAEEVIRETIGWIVADQAQFPRSVDFHRIMLPRNQAEESHAQPLAGPQPEEQGRCVLQ